ncbi:MAG: conjugal transfer protein TraN [Desulfuromonas thiophila]|jgi:conjugal transfer mating pair stabilization protein TraN|nr:conjugal transfer protein TraN [Desulfuromonas thiophila]
MNRALLKHSATALLPFFCWFCLYPSLVFATDYFQMGQQAGGSLLPTRAAGTFNQATGEMQSDMGSSTPVSFNVSEILPGLVNSTGTTTNIEDLYEDEDAIGEGITNTVATLNGEESATGEAFRTIYGGTQYNSHPDLRNDPMWANTDATLDKVFSGEYSDCVRTTTVTSSTSDVHIPAYHQCERIIKDTECNAERVVTQLAYTIGERCTPGEEIMRFSGYKSTHIYVCSSDGKSMFVMGSYTETGADGLDTVEEKARITGLPYGEEYFKATSSNYADEPAVYIATCTGSEENKVCTYSGGTWRRHHPNLGHIDNSEAGMWAAHAQSNDTHSYGIDEESFETDAHNKYTPPGCEKSDSFCQTDDADWVCTLIDNDRVINGVKLTPGVLQFGVEIGEMKPLYPGDDLQNVCWEAHTTRTCDYNIGQIDCWTDPQGVEHCPYNDGLNMSVGAVDPLTGAYESTSCDVYENDSSCRFVKSECVEYGADGGRCYVFQDTYDCGSSASVEDGIVEEKIVCVDDYTCPGGNCVNHEAQQNSSFGRAAAALQAAQFAQQDMNCGPDGTGTCRVFGGEPYECKIALGGWQDCCDQPVTVGMQQYMDMLMATQKIASAKTWLGKANPVYGGWTYIKDGAKSVFDAGVSTVGKAFNSVKGVVTSSWGSIAGNASKEIAQGAAGTITENATTTAATEAISKAITELTTTAAEWVAETFGPAVVDMFFTGTAGGVSTTASDALSKGGTATLGGQIGAVISFVGWVYLAYQIANILVQMIWECEEPEFELATKKELKLCTYIGAYCASEVLGACVELRQAYCCFQSPLSRIIMEQAKPQLAGTISSFGKPSNPNCDGMTFEDLGTLNWDLIDLSEWIGILATTGHMPDITSTDYSMEALTGSGNAIGAVSGRDNVKDRTLEVFGGASTTDTNQDLRQELYQIRPDLLTQ